MRKITIAINNSTWGGKRAFRTWLPAVPILTALLKQSFELSVVDANVNNWSIERTREEVKKSAPDVVLISALSVDYRSQYHTLAQISKEAAPDCIVVIGGVYPTVLPDMAINDPNIDFAMIGYAEERLPRIIAEIMSKDPQVYEEEGLCYVRNGVTRINRLTTNLSEVKRMVKPDYSLLDIEGYFHLQKEYSARNYSTECSEKRTVNIISSYGCPYNCFFCANHSISGSRVVYRPHEDVLEEITYFVREHSVEQISFMDDNIAADKERAKRIFEGIIDSKLNIEIQIGNVAVWDLDNEIIDLLKAAGCTRIGISVESGSQRVLYDIMHKPLNLQIIPRVLEKLKASDIMVIADFIIGLPGETWEEVKTTFKYAYNLDADLCNFNIAIPYPGTGLYKYMLEHNLLPEDFSFDDNFYVTGLVSTEEFIPAELKVLAAFEWEKVNADTEEKKKRAMKALRLSNAEFDRYCKDMRRSALRFIKNHYVI